MLGNFAEVITIDFLFFPVAYIDFGLILGVFTFISSIGWLYPFWAYISEMCILVYYSSIILVHIVISLINSQEYLTSHFYFVNDAFLSDLKHDPSKWWWNIYWLWSYSHDAYNSHSYTDGSSCLIIVWLSFGFSLSLNAIASAYLTHQDSSLIYKYFVAVHVDRFHLIY